MIKIGIIGCGAITKFRHAPEYAANAYAEIVGLFNPRTERAEALGEQYGGNKNRMCLYGICTERLNCGYKVSRLEKQLD